MPLLSLKIKEFIKYYFLRIFQFGLDERNLDRELARLATRQTAEFILDNMLLATSLSGAENVLKFAMKHQKLDGLVCEFGVRSGRSVNFF